MSHLPPGTPIMPLQPFAVPAKNHAILVSVGFLILMPIGILIPRLTRTFNRFWFYMHGFIMLLLAFPIALAGIGVGFKFTKSIQTGGNFSDGHKKVGLALLILILIQVPLGLFIHFVKFGHGRVPGHRAIQNYFHAILGLVIVALAFEQVHQGIKTEWFEGTGGNPPVPQSAERAWIGWTITFWVLYVGGLALLPRQYKQERVQRDMSMKHSPNGSDKGLTMSQKA